MPPKAARPPKKGSKKDLENKEKKVWQLTLFSLFIFLGYSSIAFSFLHIFRWRDLYWMF